MANTYHMTSEKLISSVKRRASIPDAQSMITDNEILEFANEEMALNLIPLIYSKHEDYYLVRETIKLVSGQIRYDIPYRSIGNKIREVAYLDSSKNLCEMNRISTDTVTNRGNYSDNGSTYQSSFYIEGEEIVLDTAEDSFIGTGSIVVFYNLRPNVLVESENVATIMSIIEDVADATLTNLVISQTPSTFLIGAEIDFIGKRSPHKIISFDTLVQSTDTSTNTVTILTSDVPAKLTAGDTVCISGQTNLVNSPSDLHPLLAQMVAARVLESIGDSQGLSAADKKIKKMEDNADLLLANRVTGSSIKAVNRNSTMGYRGRRGYRNGNSTN